VTARLLVHALRAARARQLRARAVRPIARRGFPVSTTPAFDPPGGSVALWRSPAFESVRLAGEGAERLRGFHAQYGDDVLDFARAGDSAGAHAAMEAWIDAHPPQPGDPWHPYPLSTRAGNWVAALALVPDAVSKRILDSLWRQLLHLERNVEDDVLGNHVIRNARALVLGGAAFDTKRPLDRGLGLLARELPEQILPDGGHYERSPVYHLVVLRDLLEIDATVPGAVPADVLDRMRRFAAALTRPDGEPALFNDGTLDLAPRLDLPAPPEGLSVFPETGYAVIRREGIWLAFDCGSPSPTYLPAHAHADALSFQLWLDGKPVVVDPGMPTYEAGAERDWFRGTRAHSTISLGGADQFELSGAFRSGPLPDVQLLEAAEDRLEAAVSWRSGVRHVRRIAIGSGEIVVRDRLEGRGRHTLESALPLSDGSTVSIEAEGGVAVVREQRQVAERLYERRSAHALVARGRPTLPAELGWRFATTDVATIDR
jgi:heparinase II/III-like protein